MGLLELLSSGSGKELELRNMKQVGPGMKEIFGERVPNPALEGPAKGAAKGLLRKAGPLAAIAGAYDLGEELNNRYGKGAYDNIKNAREMGDTRRALEKDPELATRGAVTADKIGTQAMDGVRGLMQQGQELNQQQAMDNTPQQSPMEAPQAPPQAAQLKVDPKVARAQQEHQMEATRQQLEAGTKKGLQTGETSVSQLAQGIVQADAQRAGNPNMTPEAQAKAVTAEIQTLKSMEPSNMAKYVSYALVAGGLLAAALDKSGRAGDAFSNSFNKQLDRNLAAGKMQLEARQAERKALQEDRKIDTTEKDVNSKINDRSVGQGQKDRELGQGDSKLQISRDNLGIQQQRVSNDLTLGTARNGIMSEGNQIKREGILSREGIAANKLAAAGTKADGVPLSYKDSKEAVEAVYSGSGKSVSSDLKKQIAARLPTLQKKYPQLSQAELVELAQGEYQTESSTPWYSSTPTIRQAKVK